MPVFFSVFSPRIKGSRPGSCFALQQTYRKLNIFSFCTKVMKQHDLNILFVRQKFNKQFFLLFSPLFIIFFCLHFLLFFFYSFFGLLSYFAFIFSITLLPFWVLSYFNFLFSKFLLLFFSLLSSFALFFFLFFLLYFFTPIFRPPDLTGLVQLPKKLSRLSRMGISAPRSCLFQLILRFFERVML